MSTTDGSGQEASRMLANEGTRQSEATRQLGEESQSAQDEERFFRRVELAGCLALLACALVVEFVAMPQNRRAIPYQEIRLNNDTSIYVRNLLFDEELGEESVGTVGLVLLGMVLPLLLQLAMATWCTSRRQSFDRYNTFCSYLMAVALTFLVVDVMKLYCGYIRPHFYHVCQPDDTYQFCTNEDDKDMREVRDSFPSGHAGLALAGLGSFSMYLHHRFGVGSVASGKANRLEHQIARLWSFLSILPVLLALFMGVSRIYDNYHHPADVVGGAAIGGVAAYFCHHVWFLE